MNNLPANLDERLVEAERKAAEARQRTDLVLLKIELFRMGLSLKISDYEKYKKLEVRIKKMEG